MITLLTFFTFLHHKKYCFNISVLSDLSECGYTYHYNYHGSDYVGDDYCDDITNTEACGWDGGDCCGDYVNYDYCELCECLGP